MRNFALGAFCFLISFSFIAAQDKEKTGDVTLPLNIYNELVNRGRDPKIPPRAAPSAYALGKADVTVSVTGKSKTGVVIVSLRVRLFEDEWVLVPLLSLGTAISSAQVNGKPVELVAAPEGLGWSVQKAGTYSIQLNYSVDTLKSEQGYTLAFPVPAAAATRLRATLPGTGLDVAVLPAAGVQSLVSGGNTVLTATIPTTNGIHLSWRTPAKQDHTISRASYTGSLSGNAVSWNADFAVELFHDETVNLELLPSTVTLQDIQVDGKSAAIFISNGNFVTVVKGRGVHKVLLSFQVPVERGKGPPRIRLPIPAIPVSRFELSLPGKKEVSVSPPANVTARQQGANTKAVVFMPMTDEVTFTWAEAVPESVKAEVRADANIYHLIHAEEGVLYIRALTSFDVKRGETNTLRIEVPKDVQINDIRALEGGVSEWIPDSNRAGDSYLVTVFLDRQVKGIFVFEVDYERKLPGTGDPKVPVPLIRAASVTRQRGMVALLVSKELTLNPVEEKLLSRVGENQLPAFARQKVEMTIAHTYKYLDARPTLVVQPAKPERKQGKFDARVNTLISLGDVTMKGSAGVEINVKSGGIMSLSLGLPEGANFLNLTAPSLRTYKVLNDGGKQIVDVQFTQEMEGQFRIEATYELIMADGEREVAVPTLKVAGAEVEQGRIAVEALTAVEVQAALADQLSSIDINDLPQQLILKTTNPILLAYKYVHTDPPYKMVLEITRHGEIQVQEATIDRAVYRTFYTRDGLAVTRANFTVRNNRKQFLRITLPRDSEVWSVLVAGRVEKPALVSKEDGSADGPPEILIKIVNSAQGFPVNLIFATPVPIIGTVGKVNGHLPRPDMVVTHTRWDVYLPDGLTYGRPDANMDPVGTPVPMDQAGMESDAIEGQNRGVGRTEPLRIQVPTTGIRFSFEKVYANRSDDGAHFTISYASGGGSVFANVMAGLGALLLGMCLLKLTRGKRSRELLAGAAIGLLLLLVAVGYLKMGFGVALTVLALFGVVLAARWAWERVPTWRTSWEERGKRRTETGSEQDEIPMMPIATAQDPSDEKPIAETDDTPVGSEDDPGNETPIASADDPRDETPITSTDDPRDETPIATTDEPRDQGPDSDPEQAD